MENFYKLAEEISKRSAEEGLNLSDIEEIVSTCFPEEEINCYPGLLSEKCCPKAVFISLNGKMAKGRGHLKFSELFDNLIRHVQGHCHGITNQIAIITDTWEASVYEHWEGNINTMRKEGISIESYLLLHGRPPLKIDIKDLWSEIK
jgi:hypothetical protein